VVVIFEQLKRSIRVHPTSDGTNYIWEFHAKNWVELVIPDNGDVPAIGIDMER
jgi:hypothetical protein